jgi:PTS system nitrogen regulatory IIA component
MAPADTMKIADFLTPGDVAVGLRGVDKGQVIGELARRGAAAIGIDMATIANALQARERLGSTGLGKGFALPHARVPGLTRFFGAFVRLARPIDFQAIDDQPVDLVFLLLIPADAGSQHVAALAAISRRLRDAEVLRQIRKAADAAALYQLLVG